MEVTSGEEERISSSTPVLSSTGELSGYLYKKTRDGRWQKRFFETHSVYLTYYKSKKKSKILAALGLAQVGDIKRISKEESEEKFDGLFAIELNSRLYVLRANSNQDAEAWVNILLKLRQQGLDEIENNAPNLVKNNDLKSKLTDKSDGANGNWIKFGRLCGCCKK